MRLQNLNVKNFRNFKDVNISLSNQNVIFGMNDVGKTNLLHALRFLFDRQIRQYGFQESDFFQKDTNQEIEITLEIDLSNRASNKDSQFLISKMQGSRKVQELDKCYIQAKGVYSATEYFGNVRVYWGSVLEELSEVPQRGLLTELDKVFKVVYVDPTINLEKTFSSHKKKLFNEKKMDESDFDLSEKIQKLSNEVNDKIGKMKVIQKFQETLTTEYKRLRKEDIIIEMKSEMAINGYFGDLTPYIKRDGDDKHYPTSGDGRKKLLAYSLLNHITEEFDSNKIIIYLIEEPENSLHRSMQIALSKQLFQREVYNYFFLSTHSAELLYEMDNASLIRLYNEEIVNCASHLYTVDENYKNMKKELNRSLATALFSNRVLLIEGPSERVLFEKILEEIHPTYELDGGYILEVEGIKFKPYYNVLTALNIEVIVKTDNDLKAKRGKMTHFDLIGLNRCLELINNKKLEHVEIDYSTVDEQGNKFYKKSEKLRHVKQSKLNIYQSEEETINTLKKSNIYLSKIDLEHDLYDAIKNRIDKIISKPNPIAHLQYAKMLNMIELTNSLTKSDCEEILNHSSFAALKKLVD